MIDLHLAFIGEYPIAKPFFYCLNESVILRIISYNFFHRKISSFEVEFIIQMVYNTRKPFRQGTFGRDRKIK